MGLLALLLVGCGLQMASLTTPSMGNLEDSVYAGMQESTVSPNPPSLSFPPGFMTSVKSYGAVGDGKTDDTAAIQRALADGRSDLSQNYAGVPKALYFPPGTYLVHDTLQWVGCCVALQGSGAMSSIIRLVPASLGFGDAMHPKSLVLTPSGNESFRQNIWDLGFIIGATNPGATALNYVSNNNGAIHNVGIMSEDGKGQAGIDLTRQYAGPLLIRNAAIRGFDVGIALQNSEYSVTMEKIMLTHQNVVGIRNVNQMLSIRDFASVNTVPALANSGGFVVLLDGRLTGGNSSHPALQTDSTMYLRNIASVGYKNTLSSSSAGYPTTIRGSIAETLLGTPMTLTGTASRGSLKLDVEETPSFVSNDLADWAAFVPKWYGDTSGLQAVLSSGKHTIYFPFQPYFSYAEVQETVPDSVNRIVGFSSVVNGSTTGLNGGGIRLVITSNSTQPLVIEQFGYGLKIDHRGSRPVVVKDGNYKYTSFAGAGNLYIEDAEIDGLIVQKSQRVWARQLDNEFSPGTKIANLGGSLWVLGLKTEQAGTVIDTSAGGETELLGGLIYPAARVPSTDVAFRSTDAQVSYMYVESTYCQTCGYATQIQQTRSGIMKQITSPASSNYRVPLFVGYK